MTLRAAIFSALRPVRLAAAAWVEAHGLDLVLGLTDLLRLGEVVGPPAGVCGPSLARTAPQVDVQPPGRLGELGGHVFRRPVCCQCGSLVELTVSGDETHTGEVVFVCDHCEAAEVVTFDPPVEDRTVAEWLGCVRAFDDGEPS